MKKQAFTLEILASMLLALLVEVLTVQVAVADPAFVYRYPVVVNINSPQNNTILQSSSCVINFSLAGVSFEKIAYRPSIPFTVSAKLDNNNPSFFADVNYSTLRTDLPQTYSIGIANIPEGNHTVQLTAVYAEQTDTIGRQWVELSGSSDSLAFTAPSSASIPATSSPSAQPTPSPTLTLSLSPTEPPTQAPMLEATETVSPTQPINTGAPQNSDLITLITIGLLALVALMGAAVVLKHSRNK